MKRKSMNHIQEIIRRLRQGESERRIAQDLLGEHYMNGQAAHVGEAMVENIAAAVSRVSIPRS